MSSNTKETVKKNEMSEQKTDMMRCFEYEFRYLAEAAPDCFKRLNDPEAGTYADHKTALMWKGFQAGCQRSLEAVTHFDSFVCELIGEHGCKEQVRRLWAEDDNRGVFDLQSALEDIGFVPIFPDYWRDAEAPNV